MSKLAGIRGGRWMFACSLIIACLSLVLWPGNGRAADNQAIGSVGNVDGDLDDSNVFTIDAALLSLVKAAFLADGTPLTSGATVPRGTLVKFLIYVDNTTTFAMNDLAVSDALDAAFVYQAGTIKVDSSQNTGATAAAIYAAVDATAALTDAVSGVDAAGISGNVVSAGDDTGNATVTVPASRVWALLFTVSVQ